jgi:hypothetical protein
MSTKLDDKRREDIRENTIRRYDKVELIRRWIYEKGVGVNSSWVERVITVKNLTSNGKPFQTNLPLIECIFNATVKNRFQILLDVRP